MTAIDTLEAVAQLLPSDRRERFLAMAARFRSVPEDDEYLQLLEAFGFMTLIWSEVPSQVRRILKGANPLPETCEQVSAKIRDAVVEAIPSYEDLKQIAQRLEAHELALQKACAPRSAEPPPSGPALGRCFAFVVGCGLGWASPHLLSLLFP